MIHKVRSSLRRRAGTVTCFEHVSWLLPCKHNRKFFTESCGFQMPSPASQQHGFRRIPIKNHRNGGFLKWGYPKIINFNGIVKLKTIHLGGPPCMETSKSTPEKQCQYWDVLSFTDALASMKGSCISKFFGAVRTSSFTQAIGQCMANAWPTQRDSLGAVFWCVLCRSWEYVCKIMLYYARSTYSMSAQTSSFNARKTEPQLPQLNQMLSYAHQQWILELFCDVFEINWKKLGNNLPSKSVGGCQLSHAFSSEQMAEDHRRSHKIPTNLSANQPLAGSTKSTTSWGAVPVETQRLSNAQNSSSRDRQSLGWWQVLVSPQMSFELVAVVANRPAINININKAESTASQCC